MTNLQTDRKTTRNTPSAGTEWIDRKEKCHSGLCNSIFKTTCNSCHHSPLYSHTTLESTPDRTPGARRSSMIQYAHTLYGGLLLVISCAHYGTVSYRLRVVICKIYHETFHCTVYCTMRRSSHFVEKGKSLERLLIIIIPK